MDKLRGRWQVPCVEGAPVTPAQSYQLSELGCAPICPERDTYHHRATWYVSWLEF